MERPDSTARDAARSALLLLFVINLLNYYDRTVLFAITEPVRMEFHLGDGAMGWLGTAFVLIYAAVGLPLGRLSDRGNRPRLLATGVAVWSGFTALGGVAWSFASLAVARVGVGVGEAACSPVANSLIGDLFPARQRARALSFFMLGLPLGVMLSGIVSGVVANAYGWRAALFVAGIPGLVVAVLAARLSDPPRGVVEAAHNQHADHGFWSNITLLLRIPTLRWIVITGALHNFNMYALNSFMPAYLGRYHGLDVRQANVAAGLVFGGLGIVSLVLAGMAADRVQQWRNTGRLLLATIAIVLATPCVYFALMQAPGQVTACVIWMGLGWTFAYVYYACVFASIHDVVPPALRGLAISLNLFCMYVLGGAFGTAILGTLSDRMARRAMTTAGAGEMSEAFRAIGLHDAFLIVPVIFAVLAVVLFAASRTVSRDIEAVRLHPRF